MTRICLLSVGHCDRNWYGHRLLDRCYKPVEYTLKAIEARQSCLHYSASLATVDTDFYGNITAMLLSFFVPGKILVSNVFTYEFVVVATVFIHCFSPVSLFGFFFQLCLNCSYYHHQHYQ